MECQIEFAPPVLIVRLIGTLRLAAAYAAWHTLVKLLSDEPDAQVIDLADAGLDDPKVLLILGAVARRASFWPGIPVIVAAPGPPLRTALHQMHIDRQLAVCASHDEAVLLAHGAPAPPRLRERLQPVPGAAHRARDLTTEACLRWQLPEAIAPACVIASELVTNAVCHTGGECELSLVRTQRYLHIAVRDGSPVPAVPREPDLFTITGRGLLIVAGSALRWGSTRAGQGKVVWATLPAH